jgi:hypothetical protein
MAQKNGSNPIKNALIRTVSLLHGQGYCFDFSLGNNKQLFCLQSNMAFTEEALSVNLIGQVYDKVSRQFKYIHTVETDTGQKGLLLLNHMLFNDLVN